MSPQDRYRVFGRDGLYDHYQLRDLIRQGEVTSSTDVCVDGDSTWTAASNRPELQYYLSLAATERQHSEPQSAPQTARSTVPEAVMSWLAAPRLSPRAVQLLIGAAFLLVGIVCLWGAPTDVFYGAASTHWPTAEARLIHGGITTTWSGTGPRQTSHNVVYVTYHYTVDGRPYTATLISFGNEWRPDPPNELTLGMTANDRSASAADYQLDLIRSERPLLAHYDPALPTRAVLHAGITYGAVKWLLIGLGCTGVGASLVTNPAWLRPALEKISSLSTTRLGRR